MTPDRPSIEELLDGIFTVIDAYREIGIAYRMGGRRTPNKALDTVRSFDPAAAREALRSRFLEQQKELEERTQEISRLAVAWFTYTRTATVGDGHTLDCGRWADLANGCTCGLREVEDAIEELVNPGAIQPGGTPQKWMN